MKKLYLIIILLRLSFSYGLETLNIIPTANSAALGGAGIANPNDIWVNPVFVNNVKTSNLMFNHVRWFGEISINRIGFFWHSPIT